MKINSKFPKDAISVNKFVKRANIEPAIFYKLADDALNVDFFYRWPENKKYRTALKGSNLNALPEHLAALGVLNAKQMDSVRRTILHCKHRPNKMRLAAEVRNAPRKSKTETSAISRNTKANEPHLSIVPRNKVTFNDADVRFFRAAFHSTTDNDTLKKLLQTYMDAKI